MILESTTYPGTTDEEIRPILESGGMIAGKDFHLAFSPERIDPGNPNFGPKNTPKVVGGHTFACADAAEAFYSRFIDKVVRTKGTREAEMAKLLENTYRHINIALVNEMARFCHELDIDLWDVIAAASTKPSASSHSGQVLVSAVTASRSTLIICPIRCGRGWAIPSGSSSWPRRSTPPCRAISHGEFKISSTSTGSRCGARW